MKIFLSLSFVFLCLSCTCQVRDTVSCEVTAFEKKSNAYIKKNVLVVLSVTKVKPESIRVGNTIYVTNEYNLRKFVKFLDLKKNDTSITRSNIIDTKIFLNNKKIQL